MECPNCKLINPEDAMRCDCGYDFQSKTIEKSYSSTSKNDTDYIEVKSTNKYNNIIGIIILIIGISSLLYTGILFYLVAIGGWTSVGGFFGIFARLFVLIIFLSNISLIIAGFGYISKPNINSTSIFSSKYKLYYLATGLLSFVVFTLFALMFLQ